MENAEPQISANDYYSKPDFWDERYQAGGYFDWYAEFSELQYAFQTQYQIKKQDSILMVGCGNSKLSQQMFEAGYKNIINIDISPTVIDQMKARSPDMEWLVMDALEMTFADQTFDCVIDKGTMDALIAGRNLQPALKLLKQCMRVTKQEGQLIQITYGSPEGRKKVFQNSLPFTKFDYHFAYINLNDMSALINLMRNNLVNQKGQSINKQEALQKSMKEFLLIKLLRAKRSKDKQLVVWENNKSKMELNQVQDNVKEQKSISLQNVSTLKNQFFEGEKIGQVETAGNQRQTENIKYKSKPQKQSYVYAYSIKRKFGYDFSINKVIEPELKPSYEGSSKTMTHFEIKGSKKVHQSIWQAKKYCQNKKISHSSVNFIYSHANFSTETQITRINFLEGEKTKMKILLKTNIKLTIKFKDLNLALQSLKMLAQALVDKMGLCLHPCPKAYSLFAVMKNRMNVKSVNELLAKYWYPSYKINNVNMKELEMSIIYSIPPVLPEILVRVQEQIKQYFQEKKHINVQIGSRKNGFVVFPQLKLLSTLNMALLSHNFGQSLIVEMIDFWQEQKDHTPEDSGMREGNDGSYDSEKNFIVRYSQVEVEEKILPIVVLHLMALF